MKKLKRIISILLCCSFFINLMPAHASEISNSIGIVSADLLYLRTSASSSSSAVMNLKTGYFVTILGEASSGNGCSAKWYKVSYSDKTGYACSTYILTLNEENKGATAYLSESKPLRKLPSTSATTITDMEPGSIVKILGLTSDKKWYYVDYNGTLGFVYNYRVNVISKETTDQEFIDTVLSKFPESYHSYLIKLHNDHPNWQFEPYNTNVTFSNSVTKESAIGVSLTNSPYQGFYSTLGGSYDYTTDTFYVKEGGSWYAANEKVVAYYMDPRNYLNEKSIFAYEKLSYNASEHDASDTTKAVEKTLANFTTLKKYSSSFVSVGTKLSVNPVFLATRAAQEVGNSTSLVVSGTSSTFTCGSTTYTGVYYNLFNIGAYTSENPVLNALCYAANKGWTTPEAAIEGGASGTIAGGYVNAGQDTGYLQRFNIKNGTINTSHQYMTNISAAMSEASITYSGYNSSNLLESNFVFKIPVYKELPTSISVLPTEGNPNNYLKTVTINDSILETFNMDTNSYTVNVPYGTKKVTITGLPVSSKSSIIGTGTIDLTSTSTATLTVTAQNKTTRNYTFKFVQTEPSSTSVADIINSIGVKNDGTYLSGINNKQTTSIITEIKSKNANAVIQFKDSRGVIKNNNSFSTGDTMTVTIGEDSKIYTVVVKGDTNGDGNITILDLLRVQKHILESSKLEKEYAISADVNSDNVIDILDLLKVQKSILGQGTIE